MSPTNGMSFFNFFVLGLSIAKAKDKGWETLASLMPPTSEATKTNRIHWAKRNQFLFYDYLLLMPPTSVSELFYGICVNLLPKQKIKNENIEFFIK